MVEGRHLSFSSSPSLSVNYCVPLTMVAAAAGLLFLILPPSSTSSSSSSSSCSHSSTLPTTTLKSPSLSSYLDSIVSLAMPMSSFSSFSFSSPFVIVFVFFLAVSASFSISLFLLYRHLALHRPKPHPANTPSTELADGTRKGGEENPTHLLPSRLLDLRPSFSPKWVSLVPEDSSDKSGSGGDSTRAVKKKKKRRVKKKGSDLKSEENGGEEKGSVEGGTDVPDLDSGNGRVRPELVCLYPFTSTGSAIQRRIKQQYDQLVKCNESEGLTLAQVGEFADCLMEARNELKNKSEVVKRKFTITKALLLKADRSSIDRIRQQICKLELEQKRLEEDTFVYNWLQQQLKSSPAYKKMLEISARMEMKAKSTQLIESEDTEFSDISFEELLAQEKKDVFWQKNGKSKICSR